MIHSADSRAMGCLAATLAVLFAACGDGEVRTGPAMEGKVPVARTEGAPQYTGPLFELEEELVLGIDEGEPEWQLFGSYVQLAVGDDGRMFIAGGPTESILIVSPEGELLGQFGARGSGPASTPRHSRSRAGGLLSEGSCRSR